MGAADYSAGMPLRQMKMLLSAGWLLTALVISATTGVNSVGAVVLLMGLGLVPSVLMLVLWKDPPQTLSESIQAARRRS